MDIDKLIQIKNKMYDDFEIEFSRMKFNSAEEKDRYYFGFIEAIETFSFHTMLAIMDAEHDSKDKAA